MKKSYIALIIAGIVIAGLLLGRSFMDSQDREIEDLEAMYRITTDTADDFNTTVIIDNAQADDYTVTSFTVSDCRTIVVEPDIEDGTEIELLICEEDSENYEAPLKSATVSDNESFTMEMDPGDYSLYAVVMANDSNGKIDLSNERVRYSTEAMDWDAGWTDAGSAQEAADRCRFETFAAAEGVGLSIGTPEKYTYRSNGEICARADSYIGDTHICILKQWAAGDDDFFVYCDTYPCRDEIDADGVIVTVYGDSPGEFSKADWYDDEIEYKILVYKDDGTSCGLSKEDMTLLVRGVK